MTRKVFLIFCTLPFLLSCSQKVLPDRDEIHISVSYDPDSLDPHAKNTVSNFAIASNFYEPLVQADADMKIQPALAHSWENPDVYTWIFHLQSSVKFHSGKELDSEDVVYSYKRLLEHPELQISGYLSDIVEVTAVDRYRVRIRTRSPLSTLMNKLNFVHIVPRGATSEMLTRKVDGTGAYLLVAWQKDRMISMVRNDHYWGKKPAIRSVTYLLNRTPQEAVEDLRLGKSQLVQSNTKNLKELVKNSSRFEMLVHDSVFVKYLGFDVARDVAPYCSAKKNPFKDNRVRQAIHFAIDRKELADRLPSYAVPATQPVPPFVFGYNPDISPPNYDPARAKSLLTQAGFADGFSVTLHVRKTFQDAALVIRDQLARVGIQINILSLSTTDFYTALSRKDASFYFTGIGTPTGDAGTMLELAIHSPSTAAPFGSLNFGAYSNPAVDRKIEQSAEVLNMVDRRSVLRNIMVTLMEDLPLIPLYIDQEIYGIDRSLSWKPRNDSYILAHQISSRSPSSP